MKNVMLAVLMVVAGVLGQVPMAGLQSYFPFDNGSLADESPLLRGALTVVNSPNAALPCADHNGVPNSAYDFYPDPFGEGNLDAGALRRSHSSLPAGNSARSVCFWINVKDYNDSLTGIVHWGKLPTGKFGVYLRNVGNGIYYMCIRGFSQACSLSVSRTANPMPVGTWAFVSITYASGDLRVSFNGGTQTQYTVSPTNTDTTGDTLYIGSRQRNSGNTRAMIDEVSIYNRVLSTTEIAQIYQPVSILPVSNHVTAAQYTDKGMRSYNLLGQSQTSSTKAFSYRALPNRACIK